MACLEERVEELETSCKKEIFQLAELQVNYLLANLVSLHITLVTCSYFCPFFLNDFFCPFALYFFLQKLPYPTLYFYSLFSWERGGTIGCLINKSPKFYINGFLFVRLTTLGTLIEFLYLCCFIMFSIIVSTIILINRRVNFVYHHWGCTSIYRPLSYPIRIPVN